MKILALVSTIDLKYHMGCTTAWWQLFKALYENGNEVVVIPYLGDSIESPWWRTYPNPSRWESVTYNSYLEKSKTKGLSPSNRTSFSPGFDFIIRNYIRPKWQRHVLNILGREKDFGSVLVMNVPMNHISGLPHSINSLFKIPVIYYDGDLPTSLPKYTVKRGFKFNYYVGADLSEYDAIIGNSEGCLKDLKEMGAKKVFTLQFGVDPQLVSPIQVEKDIDISFFGYGSDFREDWMKKLITIPSQKIPGVKFAVAGGGFKIDLGNAKLIGDLSYSDWRNFCCRSKINLNITRWSHTEIYASSTSRPFELAAYGACIVSQPYNGLEKWFDIGKEIIMISNESEIISLYQNLLNNDGLRDELGTNARERIIKEHTFGHRARELMNIVHALS